MILALAMILEFAQPIRSMLAHVPDAKANWTSNEIDAGIEWDELIVSWNATLGDGAGLSIEVAPHIDGQEPRWFVMGRWSHDPLQHPRESVKNQDNEMGRVDTDILVLKRPARKARVRITATGEAIIKGLWLSFFNSRATFDAESSNRDAWGKVIEAPIKRQTDYEGGRVWCSPTCVSMALGYWAKKLDRPALNIDVPEIAKAVHDPVWDGTGNWPFNAAFAGSLPGMSAYVHRLSSIKELEDSILKGWPIVLSVNYRLLKGGDAPDQSGHLVMLVGFDEKGDAIIHDPWFDRDKGETGRRTIPRKALLSGWGASKHTVYAIRPDVQ